MYYKRPKKKRKRTRWLTKTREVSIGWGGKEGRRVTCDVRLACIRQENGGAYSTWVRFGWFELARQAKT